VAVARLVSAPRTRDDFDFFLRFLCMLGSIGARFRASHAMSYPPILVHLAWRRNFKMAH